METVKEKRRLRDATTACDTANLGLGGKKEFFQVIRKPVLQVPKRFIYQEWGLLIALAI
jgi:hypothetical protein